jgi:hypothetical protein
MCSPLGSKKVAAKAKAVWDTGVVVVLDLPAML